VAGKLTGSSQKFLNITCYETYRWRQGDREREYQKGNERNEDNPTSFRRHAAFPSKQFLQVPDSLVVCPCRNVLGGWRSILSDWPCSCLRITPAIQPHGPSRPLPTAQIWMMDQPSFSAGRSLTFGRHLFMVFLKNF
jgi:hypothetical protein